MCICRIWFIYKLIFLHLFLIGLKFWNDPEVTEKLQGWHQRKKKILFSLDSLGINYPDIPSSSNMFLCFSYTQSHFPASPQHNRQNREAGFADYCSSVFYHKKIQFRITLGFRYVCLVSLQSGRTAPLSLLDFHNLDTFKDQTLYNVPRLRSNISSWLGSSHALWQEYHSSDTAFFSLHPPPGSSILISSSTLITSLRRHLLHVFTIKLVFSSL